MLKFLNKIYKFLLYSLLMIIKNISVENPMMEIGPQPKFSSFYIGIRITEYYLEILIKSCLNVNICHYYSSIIRNPQKTTRGCKPWQNFVTQKINDFATDMVYTTGADLMNFVLLNYNNNKNSHLDMIWLEFQDNIRWFWCQYKN